MQQSHTVHKKNHGVDFCRRQRIFFVLDDIDGFEKKMCSLATVVAGMHNATGLRI